MNVAICYASKTGTTKTCAEKLKKLLPGATLYNLETEKMSPEKYACIIVGGSIRMGKLHKEAAAFIKNNKDILMERKCAFFMCNGFPEQAEQFFLQNVEKELLEHSICAASFGGEMDLSKQKGFDKMVAKAVMNSTKNNPDAAPKILEERIAQFAEIIKDNL